MRSAIASILAALAIAIGFTTASAQTPTPTPALPAAPSDPALVGGTFTWVDNSNNEDGFRITVEHSGDLSDEVTTAQFEVGPNVTSFALPPGPEIQCPIITRTAVSVVAFNASGESTSVGADIAVICPAAPTATAPATAGVLPDTGAGSGPSERGPWLLWLLAAGGALTAFGALAWRLRYRGSSASLEL